MVFADEASVKRLIDLAYEAMVAVDDDHKIVVYNHPAEAMFGHKAEDAMGQSLDLLLPAHLRQDHARHLREFHGGPRLMGTRDEIVALRKNGEEFPVEASIARIPVSGREIWVAVLRDVTERKNMEKALMAYAQLHSTLLSELRHRIKNNQQSLLSLVRRQRINVSQEVRDALQEVESSIIAVNGVDSDLVLGEPDQRTDLASYLHRLCPRLERAFQGSFVIICSLDPHIEVSADCGLVVGLLVNEMVTNSFKHAVPKGATKIWVDLSRQDDQIVLMFSDDGPGMDGTGSGNSGCGVRLIEQLTGQINGQLIVDRDAGMRYRVIFSGDA